MLQKIKSERDLTVLITTHYMDEADKLCDRIAIVDHGKLVVLDYAGEALKASIPGAPPNGRRHAGRACSCTTRGTTTCATRVARQPSASEPTVRVHDSRRE